MKISNKQNKAFTLTELTIVVIILMILGFTSYVNIQGYTQVSRNTARIANLGNMKKALGTQIIREGKYPLPSNGKKITYSGATVWTQGTFGDSVFKKVSILNSKPVDPLTLDEYTYSVSNNGLEYELSGIIEGNFSLIKNNFGTANANTSEFEAIGYVKGNYNGLISRINLDNQNYLLALPSITASNISNTDLNSILNNKQLVYNNYGNIPHSFNYYENISKIKGLDYNGEHLIVYKGELSDFEIQENQLILLQNLKKAYEGSSLGNNDTIMEKLTNSDFTYVSAETNTFACNLIMYSLKYYMKCGGVDFITYYVTNVLNLDISNLSGNKINVVYQDSDEGVFWFGTDNGIAKYDDGEWTIYQKDSHDSNSLVNNNITSISTDTLGNYWFGTVNGISKFDGESTWTNYNKQNLVSTHIQYIYTSSDGTIWIGTNGGISTYNDDEWNEYIEKKDGLSHNNITAIYEDLNGNMWFGTNSQGVDKFFEGNITNYSTPDLPSRVVNYISQDSNNNMWIGTNGGLGKLDNSGTFWTSYTNLNTGGKLINDNITYIYEDTEKNLWFGTSSGLVKVNNNLTIWNSYTTTTSPNSISGNDVKAIFQDESGNVIVLTEGGIDTIDSDGNIVE